MSGRKVRHLSVVPDDPEQTEVEVLKGWPAGTLTILVDLFSRMRQYRSLMEVSEALLADLEPKVKEREVHAVHALLNRAQTEHSLTTSQLTLITWLRKESLG